MDFNCNIKKEAGKTLVAIQGRIDAASADQFQQAIDPLREGSQPDIDIDCSDMTYTSSQGLRVFLMLQKSVTERHGKMVLRNMNPQVKEVFDITGFSNIITIL